MLCKFSLIAALVAVLAYPSAALAKHARGHATSLEVQKVWTFGRQILIIAPRGTTSCHMQDLCNLTCQTAWGPHTVGVCI